MTWLKQLGIVILGAAIAIVMVILGIWQLRVYHDQGAAASAARAAEPARDLAAVAPPGSAVLDGYGRTVTFSGRYLVNDQLLVPVDGQPDRRRVLTAFRTSTGSIVAVVRGTVPAGSTPPSAPSADLDQQGLLLPSEDANGAAPAPDGQIASVRIPALAQSWPAPLLEGYVLLSPDDARSQSLEPAPVVLPEARGRLRNGAYALQWWVFAAFAIGMSGRVARDVQRREQPDVEVVSPT